MDVRQEDPEGEYLIEPSANGVAARAALVPKNIVKKFVEAAIDKIVQE